MRPFHVALLALVVGCGAAPIEPAAPAASPAVAPVVGQGGGANGNVSVGALRELALRVPAGQALAYRVKARTEQPGRKTEQEYVLYLEGWNDGTFSALQQSGEREHAIQPRELKELLPLPEGAQSTYSRTREGSKERHEPEVRERFERRPAPGAKEQLSFRIERKQDYFEETSEGVGVFDVEAMRYESVRFSRLRELTPPAPSGKRAGIGKVPRRDIKNEVEVTFDPEAATARTKELVARRELILKAAREPAGSANPMAEMTAALTGQTESGILEFLARGHPALVWRAVLGQKTVSDRVRMISFERPRVPDEVLEDVRATIKKTPSHPVAWLVLVSRDPRLVAELRVIASRHSDEDVKEVARERLKEVTRGAQPLAERIKAQQKAARAPMTMDFLFMDVDPDRDRVALFEYVLPAFAGANEGERPMYAHALENIATVSIGEDVDGWRRYWETHKKRPYEEWLIEALANDPSGTARARAAELLGQRPVTEANKQALRKALETDLEPEVRLQAAESLAALRDETAIKPLVRALVDEGTRWNAINALSYFSDSDFGLLANGAGNGTPEDTWAAIGKWLGWAKRKGVEPGFL